jgi:Domain of unknown function (DUF4347)
MDARERGTDRRGTEDRGTARRGGADAAVPSTRTAGRPDTGSDTGPHRAGLPPIGLLVYQVAREGAGGSSPRIAEAQNICEQPQRGLWQRTRLIGGVASLVDTVRSFAAQFHIVRLGILAHGDAGGVITIGADAINPATFETFRGSISQLRNYLAPSADIFIYGCVSATSKAGSALLKEISTILPGRRIIGFNVINIVKKPMGTSEVRRQDGKPCFDPEIWCTNVRASNTPFKFVNEATDLAPQAKIAQNGKVTKWPNFTDMKYQIFPENQKSDDSTLEKEAVPFGGTRKKK